MQRITSRQNAVIAEYREAARGNRPDAILLDGAHLVEEALAAGVHLQHVLVAADAVGTVEVARILDQLDSRTVQIAEASASVIDAASPVRSSSRIVALGVKPTRTLSPFERRPALVVVACDVQDPGNLGAIARVAEAAGASGLIVTGQSADPYGWKALRGSMGSLLRLPVEQVLDVAEAVDEAQRHHTQVIATVPREGILLYDAPLTGATTLLIGGEGAGLPQSVIDAADARVTIPMTPPVESLNAAVAAAVLLYEARRQRTVPAAVR